MAKTAPCPDPTCGTHHGCACLMSELATLRKENTDLRRSVRLLSRAKEEGWTKYGHALALMKWMAGASCFAPGGEAREEFERSVLPMLTEAYPSEGSSSSPEDPCDATSSDSDPTSGDS